MKTNYAGIDYGALAGSNRDEKTGIHYGVIPANDIGESWFEASESNYGEPHCPECGNAVVGIDHEEVPDFSEPQSVSDDGTEESVWENEGSDYACLSCHKTLDGEDCYGEEPISFYLNDGEYDAEQTYDDYDVFITSSPFYTRAQFCSPCAPGAGYLRNPCPTGPKTYCFDPSWFYPNAEEEVTGTYDGRKTACPYPVYRVDTDECVFMPISFDPTEWTE